MIVFVKNRSSIDEKDRTLTGGTRIEKKVFHKITTKDNIFAVVRTNNIIIRKISSKTNWINKL